MRKGQYKIRIHNTDGRGRLSRTLPYCRDYGIITDDPLEIYRIAVEQGIPADVAEEAMKAAGQVQRIRGLKIIFRDKEEGIEVWASKTPAALKGEDGNDGWKDKRPPRKRKAVHYTESK